MSDPDTVHAVALRRLQWKCRRGMRELDELLQGYLQQHGAGLTPDALQTFDQLLEYSDQQLLEILMGREVPERQGLADVVERIRAAA
ncbi:MAG: succinate dehydrogenase assembly factor 2 [Gammaproteobacteria bacterium]|nr:succinate dehydrogenase assembly factor 2 [Gammaproteobacteria bacterium]